MSMTLEEIKERLKGLDEMTLLEILDLSSEELVDYLEDRIIEFFDDLEKDLEEDEEDI